MTLRDRFEQQVTLYDGRVVGSWSLEWLMECEAREILRMRTRSHRLRALAAIEGRRGKTARDRVADQIMSIWRAEKTNRINRG